MRHIDWVRNLSDEDLICYLCQMIEKANEQGLHFKTVKTKDNRLYKMCSAKMYAEHDISDEEMNKIYREVMSI